MAQAPQSSHPLQALQVNQFLKPKSPAAAKFEEAAPATVAALEASKAPLQTIITDHESKNAELYAQRDALKQQIIDLVQQRNALEQQLAGLEGSDVKAARDALQGLEMLKMGNRGMGPGGRR